MLTPLPVQTTYPQYSAVALLGGTGDGQNSNIETGILEDPTGLGVGYGVAMSRGSLHGDKSVVVGSLSGGTFVGITSLDASHLNQGGSYTDKYMDGDNIPVKDFGTIWVSPATANVVVGHETYFNSVTGALGDSGIANATAIPGSSWMDSKPNTDNLLVPFNGLARVKLGIMT